MNYIDTHCHLDNTAFDSDRDTILRNCRNNGITRIVIPGVHRDNWQPLLQLCNDNEGLSPALGLHPCYTSKHREEDLDTLDDYLNKHSTVAVGEIGLDYYLPDTDKEKQIYYFERQLKLAQQHGLPVILHVRKSHADVIASLKSTKTKGGICHAFNGSYEQAKEYIKLGFLFGFGGMLTYPKATKIRKLAVQLPLESIVLETDSPDMTVSNHKGERNSPEYILDCAQALAQLRGISIQIVAKQTTSNAISLLGLV